MKTAEEILIKRGCAFVAGTTPDHFIAAMEEYASQFDFNKIPDIRNHLLRHPDQDMIRAACRHYLGI